jgi:hypothetical protein
MERYTRHTGTPLMRLFKYLAFHLRQLSNSSGAMQKNPRSVRTTLHKKQFLAGTARDMMQSEIL